MGDRSWLPEAQARLAQGKACVLVTVAEISGSAPRGPGAKLLVTSDGLHGTIGGGQLEHVANATARDLLGDKSAAPRRLERLSLGPALGQCCGGAVALVLERLDLRDADWLDRWAAQLRSGARAVLLTPLADPAADKIFLEIFPGPEGGGLVAHPDHGECLLEPVFDDATPLFLFGAGHVGRAVVQALEPLPFRITWIDSRPEFLPEEATDRIRPLPSRAPQLEVAVASPGSMVLVMTHSHAEDLLICEQALARADLSFVGLIGSGSKRARFVKRLRAQGLGEAAIRRLVCPIGVGGITGKAPAIIAASTAAQLLAEAESSRRSLSEGTAITSAAE